ncbi:MAG: hypothetical protein Q7T36_04145 [Fluviicoccus sp.]|uniref:hypothetical protein n=1 Tax=Fluviicoccus sp. TaxID=2003552 RepID=UPI0027276800|nr:hypothetical protein [Fluviicoccus sp.]MDO8329642.1 hypothetical protein [Fluviicoccus sp.]
MFNPLRNLPAFCLLGLMSSAALADNASVNDVPAPATSPFKWTFQAGLTQGGDTLVTTYYVSGSSEDVNAGDFLYFGGGFDYRLGKDMALRTTINYMVADSTADNGSVKFDRMPLEISLAKEFSRHRLAVGITRHFSPKLKVDVPGLNVTLEFEDADGTLIEYGYRLGGNAWITLRHVSIDYTVSGLASSVDGSHFGIGAAASF